MLDVLYEVENLQKKKNLAKNILKVLVIIHCGIVTVIYIHISLYLQRQQSFSHLLSREVRNLFWLSAYITDIMISASRGNICGYI